MTVIESELEGSPDEAKVFLSYSRKDRERASGIADALRSRHFGVFKDTDDILPTEEWRDRLQQLIEEADTIVFLLSPNSATSEVCAWEVEYATSLNKRIAPIVIEDVPGGDIPPLLARLNFIFCTPRDPFENAVDTLASALNADIGWIREHTRLAGLAARWEKSGRPARLLLRGQDVADAETWRDDRPKEAPAVTTLQAAFVAESRRAVGRRQRSWIAGSLAVTAGAVALAVFAYLQSVEADRQRGAAEESAAEAERQREAAEENAAEAERQRDKAEAARGEAERERNAALLTESRFLADAADRLREDGRAEEAMALARLGLPGDLAAPDRPISEDALRALREARRSIRLLTALDVDEDNVSDAVFTSDGARAAVSYTSGDIRIWDVATGETLHFLDVPDDRHGWGASMAFSVDGALLLAGGGDKTLRLWDVATGALLSEVAHMEATIDAVAAAPVGGRAAAIDMNGDGVLFDFEERRVVTGFTMGREAGRKLAFSDDGKWFAAAGWLDARVGLFHSEDGRRAATFGDEETMATVFDFRPGSKELAVALGGASSRVDIIDLETLAAKEDYTAFVNGSADWLEYAPGGWTLAAHGLESQTIEFFHAEQGEAPDQRIIEELPIGAAAFIGGGRWLATGSADGKIRIWNTRYLVAPIAVFGGAAEGVGALVSAPGTGVLFARSGEYEGRLWSAPDPLPAAVLRTDGSPPLVLGYGPRPDLLFGNWPDRFRILSAADLSIEAENKLGATIQEAARSFDGKRVALFQQGAEVVSVVDFVEGRQANLETGSWRVEHLAVSPAENAVAFIDADYALRIVGEDGRSVVVDTGGAPARLVAFSPDGSEVLTFRTGDFIVHDAITGEEIRRFETGFGGNVDLAITRDRMRIVKALDGDEFAVFDTASGEAISQGSIATGTIVAFSFDGPGERIAVTGDDGTISIFNAATAKLQQRIFNDNGFGGETMFSEDSDRLISAPPTGAIYSWPLYPDDAALLEEATALSDRLSPLTPEMLCSFNQAPPEDCP